MKLTQEHIGKKMRSLGLRSSFFIPLAQTSKGAWLGEDDEGEFECFGNSSDYWEFFEAPEQEIKLWSVWQVKSGNRLYFIREIEDSYVLICCPEYGAWSQLSDEGLKKNYTARPDLEVVAPFRYFGKWGLHSYSDSCYSENKCLEHVKDNPDYCDVKWPASLALCQIVEKKK